MSMKIMSEINENCFNIATNKTRIISFFFNDIKMIKMILTLPEQNFE